jgi:hypothetical protein
MNCLFADESTLQRMKDTTCVKGFATKMEKVGGESIAYVVKNVCDGKYVILE